MRKLEAREITLDVLLTRLRRRGFSVAVHNDYRLDGEPYTFWLFTNASTGRFLKGEGSTDLDAVTDVWNQHRAQVEARENGVDLTITFPSEEVMSQFSGWLSDGGGEYQFTGLMDERGVDLRFDYWQGDDKIVVTEHEEEEDDAKLE